MNENKHAPGPWHADGYHIEADDRTLVAKLLGWKDLGVTRANARLIARAPDLLRENEELERDVARHMKTIHERDREIEVLTAQSAELLEALRKTRDAWVEEASWGDGIAEEHGVILAETDDILTRMQGEEPAHRPAIAKAKGGDS